MRGRCPGADQTRLLYVPEEKGNPVLMDHRESAASRLTYDPLHSLVVKTEYNFYYFFKPIFQMPR